jgi:pyridoxine 5'-phosphate synthase PdxJ
MLARAALPKVSDFGLSVLTRRNLMRLPLITPMQARSDHGFGFAEGATNMTLQLFRLSVAALAMSGFLGADAQQPPAPQTTQTTTTTIATGTSTSPAMSKSDMKKQRKQQKHQEKAAKAEAKAAKHRADATKEQNKSVQESEKAAAPQ